MRLLAGKLPAELLTSLLAEASRPAPEVLLGPRPGEDACAIQMPAGVLVAAADPITLTSADVGAHAVAINANDVAVMGVRPRWFLAVVLLPVGSEAEGVRRLFAGLSERLDALGAVLVGGHSEVTAAVNQPVVVGHMLGVREDGRFVTTGGVEPGDGIVQVGPAPIEAAAVLADEAPGALTDEDLVRARSALREPGISVVEPALCAAELGAHALHDPTEGGLSSGLYEMAEASGLGLRIDPEAVLWFEPARALCAALGVDAWGALASGCLLAAFAESDVAGAVASLEARGFPARVLGRAAAGSGVRLVDGQPLPRFARDEVARVLA